jgi:hypothetical protein
MADFQSTTGVTPIKITFDTSSLSGTVKALNDSAKAVDTLRDAADALGKGSADLSKDLSTLGHSSDGVAQGIESFLQSLNSQVKTLKLTNKQIFQLASNTAVFGGSINDVVAQAAKLNGALVTTDDVTKAMSASIVNSSKDFGALSAQVNVAHTAYENFANGLDPKSFDAVANKVAKLEEAQKKIAASTATTKEEEEMLKAASASYAKQLNVENRNLLSTGDSINAYKKQMALLQQQYDNLTKAERDSAQGTELLTHIQSLESATQNMSTVVNNWLRNAGNIGEAVDIVKTKLLPARKAIQSMTLELDTVDKSTKAGKDRANELTKAIADQEKKISGYNRQLKSVEAAYKVVGANTDALEVDFVGLGKAMLSQVVATKSLSGAFKLLGTAMKLLVQNPLLIAITALVAIFKKFKDYLNGNSEAMAAVKDAMHALSVVVQPIKDMFDYLMNAIVKFIAALGEFARWLQLTPNELQASKDALNKYTGAVDDAASSTDAMTSKVLDASEKVAALEDKLNNMQAHGVLEGDPRVEALRKSLKGAREDLTTLTDSLTAGAANYADQLQNDVKMAQNVSGQSDKMTEKILKAQAVEAKFKQQTDDLTKQLTAAQETYRNGDHSQQSIDNLNKLSDAEAKAYGNYVDAAREVTKLTQVYVDKSSALYQTEQMGLKLKDQNTKAEAVLTNLETVAAANRAKYAQQYVYSFKQRHDFLMEAQKEERAALQVRLQLAQKEVIQTAQVYKQDKVSNSVGGGNEEYYKNMQDAQVKYNQLQLQYQTQLKAQRLELNGLDNQRLSLMQQINKAEATYRANALADVKDAQQMVKQIENMRNQDYVAGRIGATDDVARAQERQAEKDRKNQQKQAREALAQQRATAYAQNSVDSWSAARRKEFNEQWDRQYQGLLTQQKAEDFKAQKQMLLNATTRYNAMEKLLKTFNATARNDNRDTMQAQLDNLDYAYAQAKKTWQDAEREAVKQANGNEADLQARLTKIGAYALAAEQDYQDKRSLIVYNRTKQIYTYQQNMIEAFYGRLNTLATNNSEVQLNLQMALAQHQQKSYANTIKLDQDELANNKDLKDTEKEQLTLEIAQYQQKLATNKVLQDSIAYQQQQNDVNKKYYKNEQSWAGDGFNYQYQNQLALNRLELTRYQKGTIEYEKAIADRKKIDQDYIQAWIEHVSNVMNSYVSDLAAYNGYVQAKLDAEQQAADKLKDYQDKIRSEQFDEESARLEQLQNINKDAIDTNYQSQKKYSILQAQLEANQTNQQNMADYQADLAKAQRDRTLAENDKKLQYAQTTIQGLVALATNWAKYGYLYGSILNVAQVVSTAATLAKISATALPDLPNMPVPVKAKVTYGSGGLLAGKSHANGGIDVNAEGGEAIINKRSTKAFLPLLSAINQAGGGVSLLSHSVQGLATLVPKFATGGVVQDGGYALRQGSTPELRYVNQMQRQLVDSISHLTIVTQVEDIQTAANRTGAIVANIR